MAEHSGYETGKGAPMDYREHERTYSGFLWLVQYGTAAVIAILVGMLMGLIVGAGIFTSLVSVVVVMLVAHYAVFKGEETSMKKH